MSNCITWVGLDVHKSFINIAVLDSSKGPLFEWRIEHTRTKVKKMARFVCQITGGIVHPSPVRVKPRKPPRQKNRGRKEYERK